MPPRHPLVRDVASIKRQSVQSCMWWLKGRTHEKFDLRVGLEGVGAVSPMPGGCVNGTQKTEYTANFLLS